MRNGGSPYHPKDLERMNMLYDFTDFKSRVEELNRLNQTVNETGLIRFSTKAETDIQRWETAVKEWKEYSGFGCYPEVKFYFFESDAFLDALRACNPEAIECAIRYLEFDPYYFRSGYIKSKLLTRLKHIDLSDNDRIRLRAVVLNAAASPLPKPEFPGYLHLIPRIKDESWKSIVKNMNVPATQRNEKRKCAVIAACLFTG